ncbi:Ubiquitin carboxyl-terminal hydrolase 24 [Schistosoma japonicum]|nr:Ubiquitin carboxyl-terminal hydrolase 24 [Schistosoma japonicum]
MSDEENLQKLLLMGFTDEENIRAVLRSCSSDVNEAISVLSSEGLYTGNNFTFTTDKGVLNNKDEYFRSATVPLDESTNPLDKLVAGHDISLGFSSLEFNRLQSRVFTEQWDIPCLRSQSLGLCLLGTIYELKVNGLKTFELYPEVQRFFTTCLKECVTKLMTSQAVFNWDRDTLEGVHNMLELVIRLICEYMCVLKVAILEAIEEYNNDVNNNDESVETQPSKVKRIQSIGVLSCGAFLFTEPFHLLSLVFDCETNYHQLCRDRNSNTGTYADPFNDWIQISRQHLENTVFAETLPTPRNFYLVNLLNCFGVYNGFSLLSWFATQSWSNINLTSIFLLPMVKCCDYLTLYTLKSYTVKIMYRVIWRLSNLCMEDFKDRDSQVFELITSVRVLTYRLIDLNVADSLGSLLTTEECSSCLGSLMFTVFEPNWDEVILRYNKNSSNQSNVQVSLFSISVIDKLHYSLLLTAISPPQGVGGATFSGRMMALKELIQQIEISKQFENVNNSTANWNRVSQKRTRPTVSLTSASLLATENAAFLARRKKRRVLRLDHLLFWIQDNEVISKSLHKLDNTAYMANLNIFFRSLGERITNDDLTTLWHRTSHQNGAAVDNILNLLTDLASSRFTQSQLKHLFFLVELSWMTLDLQAISQVFRDIKLHKSETSKTSINSSPPLDEPSNIRHARARLLNMIGRIGISTRDPNTADMCIELLWRLAHSNYSDEAKAFSKQNRKSIHTPQKVSFVNRILVSHGHRADMTDSSLSSEFPKYMHPEPIEASLAQQLVIIREFHCSGVEQRLRAMRWLLEAMGHISRNSLTFFMLAYVKSLLEFILKNFIGKAKRDHLHELNRSHELITRLVDSLLHYEKWAISSHGDLLTGDSLDALGFKHSDVIKRHFDVLNFLLRNAELTLSVERAKALWETLIGQAHAAPFDREQAFIWFSSCLNFLDTDAQAFVFTKVILKSNPALFRSMAGFECFRGFFEKVNLNEGRMKQVAKSWQVERPDLIGLDFLWDLYLALPSSDASLDGGHSNRLLDNETFINSTPIHDKSYESRSNVGDSPKQQIGSFIASPSTSPKPTPDAAKPARLLLLNVHWGQLAPKLRRDPESCYRRFFDICRRRLESNYALGRGLINEYGITSVLAETGELLAALMLGLGPATKAKHCTRTAAKLAIRRLLGLVYAFIQSVEDEMFGSRAYHPNWNPHGCTYRGWDIHLPLNIETVKQDQSVVSNNQDINTQSSPWNMATLTLGNKPLPNISILRKSNQPVKKTVFSHDTPGKRNDAKIVSEENSSYELLDTILNRKPIGELGFQIDRPLIVRFYAELNNRVRNRASNITGVSSVAISIQSLSNNSPYSSSFSLAGPYSSTLELTSECLHNSTSVPKKYCLSNDESSSYISTFRKRLETASTLQVNNLVTKGTSVLSLNANQTGSTTDLNSNQALSTNVNIVLPSVCLSHDSAVYELLFELAESELVCLRSFSNHHSTSDKNTHLSTKSSSFGGGTQFPSTFSFIHPVRLLLACLPTYKSIRSGRNGSGSAHVQYSLVCNPHMLLNASPYRVLYKLQLLSSALIPLDTSPWWETSPGCLLSPPSSTYLISHPLQMSIISGTHESFESFSVESNIRINSAGRRSSRSHTPPKSSDCKSDWFLSVDAINRNSQVSNSTSEPSSPVLSSRRNLKKFTSFTLSSGTFASKEKPQKVVPKDLNLVADAPLIEYLEALIQLLERNLITFSCESPYKSLISTKKHGFIFPFTFRPSNLHRQLITSENEFLAPVVSQNTATDNAHWWRREVRHICLQLISCLLNPVTIVNNDEFTNTVNNSRCQKSQPVLVSSSGSVVRQMPPSLACRLLNSLLETALDSAGIDIELLNPPSYTKQHSQQLSNKFYSFIHNSYMVLPHVDSKSGVAGVIEAISYFGRNVLFQDVEISVQCIRLYFQCIIAYPCVFVDTLLKTDSLEDKFTKLLVYSPSTRIRSEMARQLEQFCILTSPFLFTGLTCYTRNASSSASFSNHPSVCSLHGYVRRPEILNLMLKTILHATLPFLDIKLDFTSLPAANILISQCSEYFRVRGFLLGLTPPQLLKTNFNTDHITILQNDLLWFKKLMDFVKTFQYCYNEDLLNDCLLAGHLNSVRLICAQSIASVSSHFQCTFNNNNLSNGCLTIMDKPASGLNSTNNYNNNLIHLKYGLITNTNHLLPPVQLLKALANPDTLLTHVNNQTSQQSILNKELTETEIPIHSSTALKLATECLCIAREFIYYLVVECLFSAARYLLSDQNAKDLLVYASQLSNENLSKRESLRRNLSVLFKHCYLPQIDAFKSLPPMTKQVALSFLCFVCRIDCQSLEKLVNLLILLHHSYKSDQITSGIGTLSSIQSSESIFDHSSYKKCTTDDLLLENTTSAKTLNIVGKAGVHWDVQPMVTGRSQCGLVGLRNGGATCYMNSVLQQLFMQPRVPETLLSVTDTDDGDEKNILFQTQRLFGHLLESQIEYYDPVEFWKSFRPWSTEIEVNPHEQQDAFDFFQALIDQLDDEFKKMKREPFFKTLYQGIFLDSKFCDECDHRYDREEVFSAINLAVKANDLHEALNQFVRGEVLEGDNAYYCERCCVKRRAVKRLSIHTLPPVLCLHLKRFDFDWDRQIPIKFSHYFKFPRQLDMTPYLTGSIQKFRSSAFFSPHSSTSALLQREAKEANFASNISDEQRNNNDLNDIANFIDLTTNDKTDDTENPVTFSNSPPSSPTNSKSVLFNAVDTTPSVATTDNSEMTEINTNHTPALHLTDKQKNQNVYKLVGIVVHSGQANSGHYYSFIKDRRHRNGHFNPVNIYQQNEQLNSSMINKLSEEREKYFQKSNSETIPGIKNKVDSWENNGNNNTSNNINNNPEMLDTEHWYRFNDTHVEPIKLSDELLEHECFGGTYKVTGSDGRTVETRTRYWSAYLLFYERVNLNTSMNKQAEMEEIAFSRKQQNFQVTNQCNEQKTESQSFDGDGSQIILKPTNVSEYDLTVTTVSRATSLITNSTKSIPMPTRIAQQIWTENMTFLRDQNIYSHEYFKFICELCEGILADVSSLRQEPERGVLATKLLSHFLFNTFLCLHSRIKLSMALKPNESLTSLSATNVTEITTKLNADLLNLLTRLAVTHPSATRCLMHFLYINPNQPCLVSLLLDPKPVARQQTASMILAILQGFYAFKETNILDGTLTGLINYLLGLFDNGQIAEHLTEAGALFGLLRGYAEMCPHATVHLSNLRAIKRILSIFIEPNSNKSSDFHQVPACYASFAENAPNWSHQLRVWSPAQHREMGNLYYLLTILLLQTSFDAYRVSDPLSLHDNATHPPLVYRQHSLSRLLLRPQKETVVWLGLSVPSLLNPISKPVISNIKTDTASDSTFSETSYFSTQLVGLYRLCEVLLKAYLENPITPTLTPLGIDDQGNQNVSAGNISAAGVNSNELPTVVVNEPISLRQRIRELMLHISASSWDTSQCFILCLLDRIHNRPQSELRQYFDLLSELLHLTDCIQPARIIAVIDGLTNQQIYLDNDKKYVWAPRPNGDRQLWAWNDTEMKNDNIQSDHVISNVDKQETNEYGPPQVHGLLNLIHKDYTRDPRRAYQCTKFIVELSTQNAAVVKYLSYYPEKWEPIVKWLRNLVDSESSDEYFSRRNSLELPSSYNPNDSVDNRKDIKMSDSDGIYINIPTGLTNSRQLSSELSNKSVYTSNEYGEMSTGFQRTVSAQTTLREATRLLSTMPRCHDYQNTSTDPEPTGLSSPPTSLMMPLIGNRIEDNVDNDDDDNNDRKRSDKPNLFLKLST